MKLYVVSGLGADFKVLSKLKFPAHLEPVFLPWHIPFRDEPMDSYVRRMAEPINIGEPFCLLGYSFGGIIVQEIHRIKKAHKIVILGSIREAGEGSMLMKIGRLTRLPRHLPLCLYSQSSAAAYALVRRFFDPTNPKLLDYFTVRDPYYLKWSVQQITAWKGGCVPEAVQVMADQDIVFPIKNCRPDYVIKGATHLFPATRPQQVSEVLRGIFTP